ncbi:N-6 DNA methylase [Clostridium bornimense]|uniref:Eco57I restriction-modification methylase domain-containing protein n=1 Tax=Clostridium bornimense TaxID=1216932 RepID=UPI001C10F415|nr:N-6 DNA methylase [Clostridium bornimense]MBU5315148.1 N-6 DNA methylase [Clostridium bornimense]
MDNYILEIKNLFDIIINKDIHNYYKDIAIENFRRKFNLGDVTFSDSYYISYVKGEKTRGVVYTPEDIADYIVMETLRDDEILKNPFVKIVDPSCGGGRLIISTYKYLKELFLNNNEVLEKFNIKNIDEHIISNNLYGYDIDDIAIKSLIIDLFTISGFINRENFKAVDYLFSNEEKFDYILGNPPYVGIKSIDKEYSKKLKEAYKNVYIDKGDLSYCFFHKGIESLNTNGRLTFITSRYFLESPSGEELRKTLKEFCKIYKIIDYYGVRPFKGIGVDPVIIFLENSKERVYEIDVFKPKKIAKNISVINNLYDENRVKNFKVNSLWLNDKSWILRSEEEMNIINKIENKSFCSLGNICNSYQGIITGCDKSFVVTDGDIEEYSIERELIHPWIKSSDINKYSLKDTKKYIIYGDDIDNVEKYRGAISFIERNKDKLLNRRETKKGMRQWYHLQWGRNKNIFESKKIVLPYKSSSNRFALDKGSFFSADVYALILNTDRPFSYDYLLKILNSDVYEFYFKSFGKKLGENLYEYYPNNLMKLCIPTEFDFEKEEDLYKFFNFTDREVNIIKENVII